MQTVSDDVKIESDAEQPSPPSVSQETTTTTAKKKKSKAQRQAAVAPTGDKTEFDGAKTAEDLVAKYNEMVLTAVDLGLASRAVKTFPDVKTGVLACERLHAQIDKARAQPKQAAESAEKEKTMKKSARKTTSARKAVKGKTTAKKPAAKAKRAARSSFDEKAKIHWNGKENPYREKSGRWTRTEKVRAASGQTVATFLAKGGRSATLARAVSTGLAKVG